MANRKQRAAIAAETIAREHRHRALVLGAWGCGVFANDPADVALWFRDALLSNSLFAGAFDRVEFAVLDSAAGAPTFRTFQRLLGE